MNEEMKKTDYRTMPGHFLCDLYHGAKREILYRTLVNVDGDSWAAIRGQEHCKRAISVAAVGDHPILFIGPPKTGKTMLVRAAADVGVVAFEMFPCPCGNSNSPVRTCRCTADRLESYILKHEELISSCEIHVEVPIVPFSELDSRRRGTNLSQERGQLDNADETAEYDLEDQDCKLMLKQAVTELGLDAGQMATVKRVAISIARLGRHTPVRVDDLCEAIHYQRLRLGG